MKRRHRTSNKIEVVERRLGREGCDGLAWIGENKIEIHTDLEGKERLGVVVHELIHLCFEKASETSVLKAEKIIRDTLWEQCYRRVEID